MKNSQTCWKLPWVKERQRVGIQNIKQNVPFSIVWQRTTSNPNENYSGLRTQTEHLSLIYSNIELTPFWGQVHVCQ